MSQSRRQRVIESRARRFAWIKTLQQGDILRSRSGVLRVVRTVSHKGPSLGKTWVSFTIRHCSWTGRCYTVMTGSDLATFGFVPTGKRRRLKSVKGIESQVQACIEKRTREFTCCDVEGIG